MRILGVLVVVSVSWLLVACGGSGSSQQGTANATDGPSASEQPAKGTPDDTFAIQPSKSAASAGLDDFRAGDSGRVDGAEREFMAWMRNDLAVQSPAGVQASDVFRSMDEARALAIQRMAAQIQSRARAATGRSTLARTSGQPVASAPTSSFSQIAMGGTMAFLGMSADLFAGKGLSPPTAGSDGRIPPMVATSDENNVHVEMAVRPRLSGSKLESEVEITVSAQKDGVAYVEKGKGTVGVDICPDAEGNVPLEISFQGGVSAASLGAQWAFQAQVTAHVDDDANLASLDFDQKGEMSSQPASKRNKHAQWNLRYTLRGMHERNFSAENTSEEILRQTMHSGTQAESQIWYDNARKMGEGLTLLPALWLLWDVEKLWQSGKCVEVLAQTPNTVDPGSETPFTAKGRQKIESAELQAPVVATLSSGGVSVDPSGAKVLSPATFRYRAPNQRGEAIVKLESRSRRGVGTLDVLFTTASRGYQVAGAFGETWIAGTICSLDAPFTLEGSRGFNGTFSFKPSTAKSGNWAYDGSWGSGYVTSKGSGLYTIEGSPDALKLVFQQGGVFEQKAPPPLGVSTIVSRREEFELKPLTGGCR